MNIYDYTVQDILK